MPLNGVPYVDACIDCVVVLKHQKLSNTSSIYSRSVFVSMRFLLSAGGNQFLLSTVDWWYLKLSNNGVQTGTPCGIFYFQR